LQVIDIKNAKLFFDIKLLLNFIKDMVFMMSLLSVKILEIHIEFLSNYKV